MIGRIVAVVTLVSIAAAALAALAASSLFHAGARDLYFLSAPVFLASEGILLWGIFDRRAPVFGRIFWRGPSASNAVAITFDDGPNEPYTGQVLDVLRAFDVKATFFVLGENVERFPESVRRLVSEGHEIGNHGFSHGVLPLRSSGFLAREIALTSERIAAAAGARPALFRAPHGWRNPWTGRTVRGAGLVPVAWTLGVWDTDRPGAEVIARRVARGLRGGSVLLLHDGRGTERSADASQVVEALPAILQVGRRAGFRFLTLSELMGEAGAR